MSSYNTKTPIYNTKIQFTIELESCNSLVFFDVLVMRDI